MEIISILSKNVFIHEHHLKNIMSFFTEDPKRIPVIVHAMRTPIGKYGGVFKDVRPDDLASYIIKALVERTEIASDQIDEVIIGCANQAGEDNRNVARMASLLAGLPNEVPAITMNRLCASSLSAMIHAAYQIRCSEADIIVAGGVESMTRAPYSIPKATGDTVLFGNLTAYDTALGWRYPNPRMKEMFPLESMGETAENLVDKFIISREDQDKFAYESHSKAARAQQSGNFDDEIIPVIIPQKKKDPIVIKLDEQPRADTTIEKLSKLQPAFRKDGSVTAGNSSSLNDGAAGVIVMSSEKCEALGLKPMAKIISSGAVGVDPRIMGIGPVPAVKLALKRAGLELNQIDLFELNEAFASQSLSVIRELGLDLEKVNLNGGAIALGHPLGCSGARIVTTLLHAMNKRDCRYGIATMCVGVGQGVAVIVEKIN